MIKKQTRKKVINFLIIIDVCIMLLFILLIMLGSPYQLFNYSDPEWTVIGTLWHSFELIFFKIAPIIVMVITLILGIIFIKNVIRSLISFNIIPIIFQFSFFLYIMSIFIIIKII